MNLAGHIEEQARAVDRNPTDGQKEAGNYRKGHVKVHGLDISIENPRGSWRTGGPEGKKWKARLPHHYGYIRKTEGGDGDHVDVYLGPHLKAPHVFIVDQHNLDGSKAFDEHKCFIGFGSKKQAVEAYHRAFSDGKGKDRIGHVETMTVDRFKDWLNHSDTTKAIKRADGGRVHMADGGVPAFDETRGPDPVSGPPPFDEARGPDQSVSGMGALASGAAQGATAGFSDELRGLNEAAGAKPNEPASLGQTIKGAYKYFTGDPEAEKRYNTAVQRERAVDEAAKAQHPYLHMAGELAGSIPAMAALPEAEFAGAGNLTQKALQGAQVGAEYGAASGAGEGTDTGSRALGAAQGIVSGIVGGAGGSLVGSGIGAVTDKYIAPIAQAVFGSSEGVAANKLTHALNVDQDLIAQGKADGMTLSQWVAAKQAGEPVTFADLGSTTTQALLRSAANTSPEARAALEKTFNDRFVTQGQRVSGDVRNLVAGGSNAGKTADQLVAEYDAARAPAYRASFAHPNAQSLWDGDFEQMAQAPTVQNALRMATVNAKDEAAKLGLKPPVNPFSFNKDGTVSLTDPNLKPNLQFWDVVKKNLDQSGREGQQWSKILRNKLDSYGTGYDQARGIASTFFGERDALEAGRQLAGKKPDPAVVAAVMRKMNPQERDLFREGYASDLSNRVIKNMSNTADITKASIFNNDNAPELTRTIFGDAGMQKLDARLSLERIMDGARKAMGNSTTARQLIEAGLAGGIGGLGAYEGDKYGGPWGGVAGALIAGGAGHAGTKAVQVGAKKLIGAVNGTTARNVAELLTSSDPAKLQQGMRMAQKNKAIGDGLKNIANRISLAGQQQVSAPAGRLYVSPMQGPVPVNAGQKQQGTPGVIDQQP